ncbi:cilia- and flagella-associated protein 57 isoform X3 [Kryptolebias marmoratus]|uniref:cilia- and flagella-associated protein 57 isoform X3 n=1 Tax=Kryptolebias marmoratus TaxID=37003 RepID=UPI0018ACDA10|nr:cilia- and flagella-associated protein 57 isoform X3 [Kryptolebias marmoratus]
MSSVLSQSDFIFGLRTAVRNNLCFLDEQTVVYPSGASCVSHNIVQRCQRFISVSEKSQGICALALSPSRRYLAVSERAEKASITVFDLHHEQGRKRKPLTAGETSVQEFVCMAFSPDSKYLIGQTGGPEWMLIFWFWEKNKVLATVKTTTSNNLVPQQISFNPHNNMQLCVSGAGVLKLLRYSEGVLKQSSIAKMESDNLLCHAWTSEDRVLVGTDTGRLLVSESGDLRRELRVTCKGVGGHTDRQVKVKWIKETDANECVAPSRITAILSYSKGFLCTTGPGTVCLFEKTQKDSYRMSREILIPSDPCSLSCPAESQKIDTMCISPAEETLAISTDRGQLYSISLSSVLTNKVLEGKQHFEFLSQPFHSSSITGLSICIRKPLVATSSLDCSVRIWNYETKELELYKEFQEEAYSVALHPTGLFILVGFSDKLRLMNLVIDDIRSFKEFTLCGCRECAFSHGGHMFAAVNGNIIHVYSFITLENILNLKGHNGKVRSIEWSLDDSRLVSCGMDGAVYEWDTRTGKRQSESVLKPCSYTGVAFSSDYKTILAVGTDFTLKEIQDCQVLREVPADEVAHTTLAVSHSGCVIFTGTSSGTIRAIKYPLPTQREWTTHHAHCGPVTKMVITYDDQFLLTVSEDGCLLISKIIDKEGRGLKSNRQIVQTEEILVTKADLDDKKQHILDLKMRLEELHMENEYQLRLKDMNYKEKLKELSDTLTQEIESLKTTQKVMKTKLEKSEHENQENSAEVAMKYAKKLKALEVSYTSKLMVEHEKYQDLLQKHDRMQEEYEKQLKAAEESKTQALEELIQMYELKLQEKTQLLAQFQEETKQKFCEFSEMIKQAEEDEERKIHAIQIKYEEKLHLEKETHTNLKGKSGMMTQKLYSLQRQIDDRCADINKLKHEQQSLLGLVHSLESDIEDLKRQISGHKRTSQDKDNTISDLKKKTQNLEKLKFLLEFQLNDLQKQNEPQQADINKKRERIDQQAAVVRLVADGLSASHVGLPPNPAVKATGCKAEKSDKKLEEQLVEMDRNNSQLKLAVSDLRLKLRTKEKELHKEIQKGKDLQTLLERLQSDLHGCVGFIQEPKKLKHSIQMIYARYAPNSDSVKSSADDIQALCYHREQLEKTISSLKMKLAKSADEHQKMYDKIMKENMSLITEINELRKELQSVRTRAKDPKAQLLFSPTSRPISEGGLKKTSAEPV